MVEKSARLITDSIISEGLIAENVKTRSRVLRAGFGSASADKFLSESVRILAERLTQSEYKLRLC